MEPFLDYISSYKRLNKGVVWLQGAALCLEQLVIWLYTSADGLHET